MGTAISPGETCLRGQSRLWSWRDRGKEGGYRQLRLRDRGREERLFMAGHSRAYGSGYSKYDQCTHMAYTNTLTYLPAVFFN